MKPITVLAALVAAVAVGAGPSRAELVIDSFRSSTYPYPAPTGLVQGAVGFSTISETGLDPGETIGGVRTVSVAVGSNATAGDFANVRVSGSPMDASGSLSYSSTTGADGSLTLSYGLGGGAGLDLDLSDHGAISVGFLNFDRANGLDMPVTLRLVDMDGVESSVTLDVTAPGAQSLNFSLAQFSSLVDLSRIKGIELLFEAGLSADFRLSSITAVPEPSGMALLGAGLAGVAGVAWRRRMRAGV